MVCANSSFWPGQSEYSEEEEVSYLKKQNHTFFWAYVAGRDFLAPFLEIRESMSSGVFPGDKSIFLLVPSHLFFNGLRQTR